MQDMTSEEFVARLGDHPAEMAMREYMRHVQPRNPNMLRSLSGSERKALWDYAEAHAKANGHIDSYLELGVNCGVSMWIMAQLVKPGGMIVGVDMLSDRADPKVQARMKAAACIYDLRKIPCAMIEQNTRHAFASVYAFAPFGALLIDGDHTYEGALLDWNDYVPMVKRGGLVIMHDIEHPVYGCGRVWRERRGDLSAWYDFGNLGLGVK
jgi:predicted O-methyltransferase YrrM